MISWTHIEKLSSVIRVREGFLEELTDKWKLE
jgi:hypothetical protein